MGTLGVCVNAGLVKWDNTSTMVFFAYLTSLAFGGLGEMGLYEKSK